MIIRTLDELAVYQKALIAADAVSAIIDRPTFEKDRKLKEQLAASSSQVAALIAEGFEQKTDRHFAHYLYLAHGSAKETNYDEIARMSSGLIQHLEQEDRQHRQRGGNHTLSPESPD